MSDIPAWHHSFKTFGDAIGVSSRTVKTMEAAGEVRAVRFGSTKKPIVRLEPPEEYLARQGRFSGPQPVDPAAADAPAE